MFGYITAKEAKEFGFTHHGKCFGIPIWITDESEPMVATKWQPMEYVMTAAQIIEGILHSLFWPDVEPGFQFLIGKPIDAA